MRKKDKKIKKDLQPDLVYNSTKVAKLVNYIMKKGKKNIARKIVYDAMDLIKEKAKTQRSARSFRYSP